MEKHMKKVRENLDIQNLTKVFEDNLVESNRQQDNSIFKNHKLLAIWAELEYKKISRTIPVPTHVCTPKCHMRFVNAIVYRQRSQLSSMKRKFSQMERLSDEEVKQYEEEVRNGIYTNVIQRALTEDSVFFFHLCIPSSCKHLKTPHMCEDTLFSDVDDDPSSMQAKMSTQCPHARTYNVDDVMHLKDFWVCGDTGNVHLCGDMCRRSQPSQRDGNYVCELTSCVISRQMAMANDYTVGNYNPYAVMSGGADETKEEMEENLKKKEGTLMTKNERRRHHKKLASVMNMHVASKPPWERPYEIEKTRTFIKNIIMDVFFSEVRQQLEVDNYLSKLNKSWEQSMRYLRQRKTTDIYNSKNCNTAVVDRYINSVLKIQHDAIRQNIDVVRRKVKRVSIEKNKNDDDDDDDDDDEDGDDKRGGGGGGKIDYGNVLEEYEFILSDVANKEKTDYTLKLVTQEKYFYHDKNAPMLMKVPLGLSILESSMPKSEFFRNVPMMDTILIYMQEKIHELEVKSLSHFGKDFIAPAQRNVVPTEYNNIDANIASIMRSHEERTGKKSPVLITWDSNEWTKQKNGLVDIFTFIIVHVWTNLNRMCSIGRADPCEEVISIKRLVMPLLYMMRQEFVMVSTDDTAKEEIIAIPKIEFSALLPNESQLGHFPFVSQCKPCTQSEIKERFKEAAGKGMIQDLQLRLIDVYNGLQMEKKNRDANANAKKQ